MAKRKTLTIREQVSLKVFNTLLASGMYVNKDNMLKLDTIKYTTIYLDNLLEEEL